jgi:hypothetical protein
LDLLKFNLPNNILQVPLSISELLVIIPIDTVLELVGVFLTHVIEIPVEFITVVEEITEVVVPNPLQFSFELFHGMLF